jgi:hypothetical protein
LSKKLYISSYHRNSSEYPSKYTFSTSTQLDYPQIFNITTSNTVETKSGDIVNLNHANNNSWKGHMYHIFCDIDALAIIEVTELYSIGNTTNIQRMQRDLNTRVEKTLTTIPMTWEVPITLLINNL